MVLPTLLLVATTAVVLVEVLVVSKATHLVLVVLEELKHLVVHMSSQVADLAQVAHSVVETLYAVV